MYTRAVFHYGILEGNFSSRTKLVQMVLIISFDDQPPIVPTIWLIKDQI